MSLFTKVYRLDKWSKNIKDDYYRLCVLDNWRSDEPLTDELIKAYGEKIKAIDQATRENYHPMNIGYIVCAEGLDVTEKLVIERLGGGWYE